MFTQRLYQYAAAHTRHMSKKKSRNRRFLTHSSPPKPAPAAGRVGSGFLKIILIYSQPLRRGFCEGFGVVSRFFFLFFCVCVCVRGGEIQWLSRPGAKWDFITGVTLPRGTRRGAEGTRSGGGGDRGPCT